MSEDKELQMVTMIECLVTLQEEMWEQAQAIALQAGLHPALVLNAALALFFTDLAENPAKLTRFIVVARNFRRMKIFDVPKQEDRNVN